MAEFQPFSRRVLRIRLRSWLAENRSLVAMLLVGVVALLAIESWVLVVAVRDVGLRWYLIGLCHAGMVGIFVYVMNSSFLAHDREAIHHLRGAWGEENTRSELQRAKRRRLIWGWVDSVTVDSGDIDHLVVTRAGGLVAIDSKWRNQLDPDTRADVARSAQRSSLRAQGVVETVLRQERGSHRARTSPITVKPLIVLWGKAQHSLPDDARIDGVPVIGGRQLVAWLKRLDGEPVDRPAAREVLRLLEDFRATRWRSVNVPKGRA